MPTAVCSTRVLLPKENININGVPMHGLRVFDNALVFVFSMCVWSLILGWGFFLVLMRYLICPLITMRGTYLRRLEGG